MSNLKQQGAAIRQQLAVRKVDQVEMRLALETQAKALDQLLDLVGEHEERLAERMEQLEQRIARLDDGHPPAA